MSKNNDKNKSLEKLDAQIDKLKEVSKEEDKTPVIKKKDLVRKVKAKTIDEEIEKNKDEMNDTKKKTTKKKTTKTTGTKSKTTTTKKTTTKKKKVPENVEIKEIENNLKVKKTKKKKKNSKTTKEVKKINDNNIIVDEEETTFSEKISSKDIEELENNLREIYDKEVTIKETSNDEFFVNEFINNIEEKINKVQEKVEEKAQDFIDKVTDLSEKPITTKEGRFKNVDILTVTTWFLGLIFIVCLIFFISFVVWILTY